MSAMNMSGSTGQEERESLLSAMYDGEVTAGEGDLVARRLARDPALRRRWSRYALSAAVLRGEQEFLASSRFATRIAAAIGAEPAHGLDESADARARRFGSREGHGTIAAATPAAPWSRWWRPVAGVAVAAGVAAASILILRFEPVANTVVAQSAGPARGPAASLAANDPHDYTTPGTLRAPHPLFRDRAVGMPAAQLANYVVAHSEFSNPLGRRNMLSALMAGESFGGPGTTASGPGLEYDSAAPPPGGRGELADGAALDEPAGAGNAAR